ncbi:DUF1033 family protein [Psychrobacillus sp. PGGUH221]|uniref:DUF1033 family protein n=1 Tax=Psychrobacillus sp. PGGUH221 TaxID=3020058 RepID=UPI0035C70B75
MIEIIYMKADYEPWYEFDGWEEHIVELVSFKEENEALEFLNKKLEEFRRNFPFEKVKRDKYWAFWSVKEQCFCDSCDEDLQIYHGIIWNDLR